MKRKKLVVAAVAVILTLSTVIGGLGIFIAAYSNGIDYSFDEALFDSAKASNITKIYYDCNKRAKDLESYVPTLYETVSLDATRKAWVPYGKISDEVKNSFLSMEDRAFFQHKGINIKRSFAAVLNYFFNFKSKFGGSTITQQVIKNISGDNERSLRRKFNEMLRAIHLEYNHTKDEIFEVYLNIVALGENVVGVEEAAELYFGKSAAELNYKEAAMIVGIANAPTRYNPYKHPEECLEKRNKVLYSLKDCGYIGEDYYNCLIKEGLGIIAKKEDSSSYISWFAETVCNDVARDLGEKMDVSEAVARKLIYSGGYSIYSTVSPEIQDKLTRYFENYENFPKEIGNGLEYSMVVSESSTSNLLGIVGAAGKKSGNRLLNRAEINITPGSSLKPLALYAPLLDEGLINWASVFDDVPVEFKEKDGEYVSFPKNSPLIYDGLTTVKDALKNSKNTVAVRLYNMLGPEKIYGNLKENFGFESLVYRENSLNNSILTDLAPSPLALGQLTYGVSLRKLTEAYNVFSNDGTLCKPRSYVAVLKENGELLLENKCAEKKVFKTDTARIMNKLLEKVVEEGTAKKITLKEIVDTAGKTGTSGYERDKVFVGYTPDISVGIWTGYSDSKKSVGTLSKSHIEIWDEIMKEIYGNTTLFSEDKAFSVSGLEHLPYCKDSGKLYTESCLFDPRGTRLEYGYFSPDNIPIGECDRHILCKYDELTKGIAHGGCNEENLKEIALLKIYDRSFPAEIIITDAEYVYREVSPGVPLGDSYDIPFFYYSIPDGIYVGRSKNKKQYNSSCYIH